ncbi:MAG TPA: hypothetical protein VMG12_26245 [Polyangiaceae bacterium]|nr:hypothetical protein [Polyangiaceae bacterium]
MTKTCLRLLFLAALAAPFAHGCGDSSLECLGEPVACEAREIGQCSHGCKVFTGCVGPEVTCESLTDRPMLCVQTGDCRYVGSCQGRPGCDNLDYDACGETPGCEQVARCSGTSVTCASLEDSQCELHPQCRLGEQCQGDADSCDSLDSSGECSSVPGCFPADTKPVVID